MPPSPKRLSAPAFPSSRLQTERTIAAARVALAVASLFAVWLDPAEPARFAETTYTLHAFYVIYSLLLATYLWLGARGASLALATHIVDIVMFSVFQYLTLGPSSPFFVYFVFSLFCGAMRWGWHGTLRTAGVVVIAFLMMGGWMSQTLGPIEFELNRFIIRIVYLAVAAGLLVHLGRYEARLRSDIERLARWPVAIGPEDERIREQVLQHAAQIIEARRAVAVWDAGEEPAVHVAVWWRGGFSLANHAPDEFHPLVPQEFETTTFLSTGRLSDGLPVLVARGDGELIESDTLRVHPGLLAHVDGVGVVSTAFRTERVSGRVFFSDLGTPRAELVPLTEVVAREIGASFDQLHITQQLQTIAAGEERIRVARDLHDGVLQSLTGIRLELRSAAGALEGVSLPARDGILAIERAVSIEQRELRLFIEGLRPTVGGRSDAALASRLDSLRERISLQWKTPVTISFGDHPMRMPPSIEQEVPLMVNEGIVNALKHGEPSRVSVTVGIDAGTLRLIIADDGHGFPFRGRYDHAALTQMQGVPRSLLDRVSALGGQMSIESTELGSRVELVLSV